MKYKRKSKVDLMLTPEKESNTKINWYPGHMLKATKQLIERIKKVDIIFEIIDARAPLMTSNKELKRIIGEKSKLVIINKSDLVDPQSLKLWKDWFKENEPNSVFISSTEKDNLNTIVTMAYNILNEKYKLSNPDKDRAKKIRAMIIGIPNCGKSTLINSLVNRKAARAANKPGHTTAQQWINLDQETQLLDTPGIMPPRVESDNHGKILSALHAIPDNIIGKDEVALFIIKYLLNNFKSELLSFYEIKESFSSPVEFLDLLALKRGALNKGASIDYERVYQLIINDFRAGSICKFSFNKPPIRG